MSPAPSRRPSKGVHYADAKPNGDNRPGLSSRHPSIDPDRLIRMDRYSDDEALKTQTTNTELAICRVRPVLGRPDNFNVVFVGAGNMMFGKDLERYRRLACFSCLHVHRF